MATSRPQRHTLAAAVIAACMTLPSVAAHAQDAPEPDPSAGTPPAGDSGRGDAVTLATMTVTAQKREEVMQDVPIMITALPEQLLRDTGVDDIKDVQLLVPGLHVSSTTNESQTTARIRGVGTNGDNAGLESAVGVVIDGVYRPRTGVGYGDLGEIERIEVIKGPQGTVFGKNTSAGVINVVTRRPSYTQSAEGEITVGNYGEVGLAGSYNDALGEHAAFRIYAAQRTRDGVTDVVTGKGPRTEDDDSDRNFHTVRGQLLLQPTDDLDINFIADFTSREEHCCTAVTTSRDATGAGPAAIINALAGGQGVIADPDPDRRLAYSNRGTAQDVKDKGVSAQADWTTPWFGGATLTSITAFRDWQTINGLDFDFSGADLLYRRDRYDDSSTAFETFSQELRLTGTSGRLDWMVGMFYSDEDLERHDQYVIGADYEPYISTLVGSQALGGLAAQLAPLGIAVDTSNPATFFSQVSGVPFGSNFIGDAAQDLYRQNAKSAAIFSNNTFHATERLDVTVGLRYTRDRKELTSVYDNPNGSLGCGALLANPGLRVGSALAGRIPAWGLLTPEQQAALVGAVTPSIAGYMCLPWANALHEGRITRQEMTEKEWSGTVKAAYRWNDNVMTYASAARGYKGGGFNLDRVQSADGLSSGGAGIVPVDDTSFRGEFVDSYELGAKTTWMDGNLLLNGTLFHQEFTDFQLNSFLGTSYVVRSLPEVVSQGAELELLWQTGVDGLSLQGGVTYADTRYGDQTPYADLEPGGALQNLPGSHISFAPLWSASAAVTYGWDFGAGLAGRFNIGSKYVSEHNTGSDLDPEKVQEGFALVNARLAIGARDQGWTVELWGQNLTDETYKQVGFDAPLQPGAWNAFLGMPRTYGVTLRVQY